MLAWLYWNPSKEIFYLPWVNLPIYWYSCLFALGFFGGYHLFRILVRRYLLNYPYFIEKDIVDVSLCYKLLKDTKISLNKNKLSKKYLQKKLNNFLEEENECVVELKSSISYKHSKAVSLRLFLDNLASPAIVTVKERAKSIADRFLVCMVIATILGARIGHLVFYEHPSYYLSNPLVIFQTWKGGLASHGAAAAIIIMIIFFARKIKKDFLFLDGLALLDLVAIPTAFAAIFIRLGNFFNQEILGRATTCPWGVVFGNPADNSLVICRHPTQLYEAFFYLIIFLVLYLLSRKNNYFLGKGKMIGLFFIFIFGSRFIIEFFKINESYFESTSFLMGQYLSIPFILLGFGFVFYSKIKNVFCLNNL